MVSKCYKPMLIGDMTDSKSGEETVKDRPETSCYAIKQGS